MIITKTYDAHSVDDLKNTINLSREQGGEKTNEGSLDCFFFSKCQCRGASAQIKQYLAVVVNVIAPAGSLWVELRWGWNGPDGANEAGSPASFAAHPHQVSRFRCSILSVSEINARSPQALRGRHRQVHRHRRLTLPVADTFEM